MKLSKIVSTLLILVLMLGATPAQITLGATPLQLQPIVHSASAVTDYGLNGEVRALAVVGTDLYVGGLFTQTQSGVVTGLSKIAKYDTVTETWSTLTDNGLNGDVYALAAVGTDLYVGGAFSQTKGGATTDLNYIAKYDTVTKTWSALTDKGLSYAVYSFGVVGNDLYIGGAFSQTNGGATTNMHSVAKYDTVTKTWSALTDQGLNSQVYDFALVGDDLYMVGVFNETKGGAIKNLGTIAKYNTTTTTWSALPDKGLNGTNSNALLANGTDLYAGGWFTGTMGGANTDLNFVTKYDTTSTTWSAFTDTGLDNQVNDLALINTDLYMGGWFTQTSGAATTGLNKIAKYDIATQTWSALTDKGLNNLVDVLAVVGTDLYVGGKFTQTSGGATTGLNKIAKYDTTTNTWSALTAESLVVASSEPADTSTKQNLSQLIVTFNKDVVSGGGTDAGDYLGNYLLMFPGANNIFDTVSCNAGPAGDDGELRIKSASYNSATFTTTLTLYSALETPTHDGKFRLFVCGTTSVHDLNGLELNGGLSDAQINFTIGPAQSALPETGFRHGEVTQLPNQPAAKAYENTAMTLEIPKLGVNTVIVGVPQSDASWDVTWLGNSAGYLAGSAFPTWAGNTVITGHVWDAYNQPGAFAEIKSLKYGDQVQIQAWGQTYTYEVRESKLVTKKNVNAAFQAEEYDWVTLVTCEFYNPFSGDYLFRRAVRAVLISVQ